MASFVMMENQTEMKIWKDMETGIIRYLIGIIALSMSYSLHSLEWGYKGITQGLWLDFFKAGWLAIKGIIFGRKILGKLKGTLGV